MNKKEITKEEFFKILEQYPNYQQHTLRFCTPSPVFFWKDGGTDLEDRSFGKGSFLVIYPDLISYDPYIEEERYFKLEESN